MITDVAGVAVGQWTDADAMTGCTVLLLPEGTVASGEVRGGAPATREFALLAPERLVSTIDAVVLAGGSAFGLAAADGVMRWLYEHDRGFPTTAVKVPIVVAMGLYDLHRGAVAWPTADAGYAAAAAATGGAFEVGSVGAGIGATTNKWRGPDFMVPGGLVSATERDGELVVSALLAVNAHGQIDDGEVRSWPEEAPGDRAFQRLTPAGAPAGGSTTIGMVVTNARLDKLACHWVAQGGHDGFARALVPSHGRSDGDALVAAATGVVDATVDHVRFLACRVVERAIRSLA